MPNIFGGPTVGDLAELWKAQPTYKYETRPLASEDVIVDFVRRVKERAERNMQATGTVSGAHWNAMRQVLKDMGIEMEL